ncbi:hypothetical protein F5146DRAFT_1068901 [Armillaria mellea]|nr:hypothetical protein F5146DRAFT_1068901 [Armillaria mellea]
MIRRQVWMHGGFGVGLTGCASHVWQRYRCPPRAVYQITPVLWSPDTPASSMEGGHLPRRYSLRRGYRALSRHERARERRRIHAVPPIWRSHRAHIPLELGRRVHRGGSSTSVRRDVSGVDAALTDVSILCRLDVTKNVGATAKKNRGCDL